MANVLPTAVQQAVQTPVAKLVLCATTLLIASGCAPGINLTNADLHRDPEGAANYGAHQTQLVHITPDVVTRQHDHRNEPEYLAYRDLIKNQPDISDYRYRVGVGDTLGVRVWGHPELSTETEGGAGGAQNTSARVISEEGTIFFPFLGEIKILGLTVREIRKKMAKGLSQYIESPQLDVRVLQHRSQKVYVSTEKSASGIVVPITEIPLTILDAVNLSGRGAQASRGGGTSTVSPRVLTGRPASRAILTRDGKRYKLDLTNLLEEGINPGNVLLQDQDIVFIPDALDDKIFVLGETTALQRQINMRNGHMSLAEAIAQVGGANQVTTNASGIYVLRGLDRLDENGESYRSPVAFHLNARRADALVLADQFNLQPRDIVFISTYGLTRFNRIISQMLPSLGFTQQVRITDNILE